MKKIMFNDRFGLTQAVLEGRKTMTRRIIPEKLRERAYDCDSMLEYLIRHSPYKVGEVVAVAQSYKELLDELGGGKISPLVAKAGYMNKMFVRAELMPHQIKITGYHVERLQDISDEDCLREGVRKLESEGNPTMFTFDGWKFKNKVNRCADSPKEAFAGLIDKVFGKGTRAGNPWVYVYEFELVR